MLQILDEAFQVFETLIFFNQLFLGISRRLLDIETLEALAELYSILQMVQSKCVTEFATSHFSAINFNSFKF